MRKYMLGNRPYFLGEGEMDEAEYQPPTIKNS